MQTIFLSLMDSHTPLQSVGLPPRCEARWVQDWAPKFNPLDGGNAQRWREHLGVITPEHEVEVDENSWVSLLRSGCWEDDVTAATGPNYKTGETVWPSMPAAAVLIVATKEMDEKREIYY